jgi:hypothetical protein
MISGDANDGKFALIELTTRTGPGSELGADPGPHCSEVEPRPAAGRPAAIDVAAKGGAGSSSAAAAPVVGGPAVAAAVAAAGALGVPAGGGGVETLTPAEAARWAAFYTLMV